MDSLPFPPPSAPAKSRKIKIFGLGLGVLAMLGAAFLAWQFFGSGIRSQNAQVDGPSYVIRAAVPGRLIELPVTEGQAVQAGALLYAQDDTSLVKALAEARAALALAARGASGPELQAALAEESEQLSRRSSAQRKEEESARKNVEHWTAEYSRILIGLRQPGLQPGQARDALVADEARVRAELDSSKSQWEELSLQRAQTDAALARLRRYPESALPAPAAMELWQRRIAQAEKDLSEARAFSPIPAVITWISARPGQDLQRGDTILSLISSEEIWVTASFSRAQMLQLSVGQACTVSLDANAYAAHITSLTPNPSNPDGDGLARVTFDVPPSPLPYPGQNAEVRVQ